MKNLAVINAAALTPLAAAPLSDGRSAVDRVLAFARSLPGVEEAAVLCRKKENAVQGARPVVRDEWTARVLLEELTKLKQGYDNIFYFFGDAPFLDSRLAERMFANHVKYFADYTFADGYPAGLSVEILTAAVIEPLAALVKDSDTLARDTLFEVLRRDINTFDLETEIAPQDLRQLRVTLFTDTRRNFQLCDNILRAGGRDERSVLDVVTRKPELLRTLPAYVNMQIVEGCPQVCSYCPYPVFGGDILGKKAEMRFEDAEKVIRAVKEFAGDATVSFSLWGEPSLHSRIDDLCRLVLTTEGLDLVIETSGVGWRADRLRGLASSLPRPPAWIVSLDAWEEAEYKKLRGEGFAEAAATARLLMELFPGRAYAQAVRMKDNDTSLEAFYRGWKKETGNLIIQKYDSFAGFLPDRKVSDLSPLKRRPCWHLKRDLSVLINGDVPMCREDVQRARLLGNLLSEPLQEVWERGEAVYREHLAEAYGVCCQTCDEYYTYNF